MTQDSTTASPSASNESVALLPSGAGPDLEKVKKLDAAIIKARAEFPLLTRNGTNPAFKSSYATLDDVLACVMPVCNKHGLNISTANWFVEGKPCAITSITHKEGGFRQSCFPIADVSPQKAGGTMTYAQRYQICSLLGIQAEDDDDGNTAQGVKSQNGKASSRPAQSSTDSWL